jgi:CRP/FNR family cyclic AMP-dependent transcriptional regulator
MSDSICDKMSLFQGLNQEQRSQLDLLFFLCFAPSDIVLFEQGEPAEYLYVVLKGEVNIRYKPEDGPELSLTRVRPEGVVGWSAAIGSPNYTSSAVCTMDCELARVRSQDLRILCDQQPETGALVLERLAAVVAERLNNKHSYVVALLQQGLSQGVDDTVAAG